MNSEISNHAKMFYPISFSDILQLKILNVLACSIAIRANA